MVGQKKKTSKVLSKNRGFGNKENKKNLGALFTKQVFNIIFFRNNKLFLKIGTKSPFNPTLMRELKINIKNINI